MYSTISSEDSILPVSFNISSSVKFLKSKSSVLDILLVLILSLIDGKIRLISEPDSIKKFTLWGCFPKTAKYNGLCKFKSHNWNTTNIRTKIRSEIGGRIGLNDVVGIVYSGKKETIKLKFEME